MFRVSQHQSSGVLKTVPAASGAGHTTCTATPLQRGLIGTDFYSRLCMTVYYMYFISYFSLYSTQRECLT